MMENDDVVETKPGRKERPKKKVKNVFTYMESTMEQKSPKSLLYKSIQENRKIKVWTRSHSYVRSICLGYLIAFDKYWNLAMIDVDEVYKVPCVKNKSEKTENNICANETNKLKSIATNKTDESLNHVKNPLTLQTLCKVKTKGYDLHYRHVNQILVRGDNVVMVTYAD